MSRRQKVDYIAVFKELVKAVGGEPKIEEAVLDFEPAAWLALHAVFPEVERYGCVFHYSQAIYKHVQKIGLSIPYKTDQETRRLIKTLFTLPMLPLREMCIEFSQLKDHFEDSGDLMNTLYNYMAQTWFGSSVWKPRNLCGYRRLVRTNNDLEGYHRRINGKLGKDPPIYDLVKFLFKEGKKVNTTCKIITCKNVKMERRKNTREKQAHLTELWNQFEEGEIDSKELLEEAAKFSPSFDAATKKKKQVSTT